MIYSLKTKTDFPKSRLLQVNSCGSEHIIKSEYTIFRPEGRNDYLFLYLKSGWLDAEIGDKKIRLTEGECAVFYPNMKQKYTFLREGNPVTFWLHFTGDAATEAMTHISNKDDSVYKINEKVLFESLFAKIIRVHNFKTSAYISEENSLLLQIITIIAKESNENKSTSREEILNAMEYISTHISEDIDLKEYAKKLNLSYSRFTHLFKETTGIAPYQYVLKLRLEQAAYLLEYSTMSIFDVSNSAGFEDNYYFSRIFKKKYSLSPRQYRKSKNYTLKD